MESAVTGLWHPSEDAETRRMWRRWIIVVTAVLTLVRIAFLRLELVPLAGDEAQYWSWSLEPAFGYFSKPPLIAWVIRLTTAIAGDGEFGVKLAAPLAHAATTLVVFAIGERLFGGRVGLWAGLLFVTMPAVSFSSVLITTDPLLLAFWAIGLYGVVRALNGGGWRWWLLAGGALGFALLAKYTAVALSASIGLFLATSDRHRRELRRAGPYLALAIAAAMVVPNLVWNARHGFITFRHVGDTAQIGGSLFHPLRVAEFLGAQLAVFGPISFVVLVLLLVRWRRTMANGRLALLLWCAVPLLAAMVLQSLLARANANWAGPIYVSASVAVAAWLADRGRVGLLRVSLVVHLALAAVLYGYEPTRLALDLEVPARFDPLAEVRGWPELGRRLAELRSASGDPPVVFEYRMVLAECLYYARLPLDAAFTWNPGGVVRNHYDLVTDLDTAVGRDLLYVSRSPSVDHLRGSFDAIVELAPLEVAIGGGRSRRLYVSRLVRFRGYATAAGGTVVPTPAAAASPRPERS